MAKPYSDTEIQTAVTKLVRDSIRFQYGPLGNRDLGTTFSDLQDAAAGVFILTPNAPFYVAYLAAQRLNELLVSELETLQELIDAVSSTNRYTQPITRLSPLRNASVALSALESASISRTRGFNNIASVPSYQRFIRNTSKFLEESSSGLRNAGQLTQTPEEARSSLAGLVRGLTEAHAETLRRVGLLAGAIEDFESLSLGRVVASSIISNARQVLSARADELEAMEVSERGRVIRDVTLDILAARAAVTGFGSLTAPTTFVQLEGQGNLYTDSTHLGTSARVEADLVGPYPILPATQELQLTVDGGPTLSVLLQGSFVPFIEGTSPEPYNIYGPLNPPPPEAVRNDHFVLSVPGFPNLDVLLTQGNSLSIESVVAELNAAITTQPIVFEPAFLPEKFVGLVDLDATGSSSDLDLILLTGSWLDLPLEEGDKVLVDDITSISDGAVYTIDVGGISATTLTCTQISGPVPSNESIKTIRIGPPNRFVRVRIADGSELQALQDGLAIRVEDPVDPAHVTLGFFPLQEARSRMTTAQEVANSVNTSFGAQVGDVARATAEAVFVVEETWLGRSEPTNPLQITLLRWRGQADITGGTNVTFSLGSTTAGAQSDIQVGDGVVLRSAAVPSDVGQFGVVNSLSGTGFEATFTSSITAATGLIVDVGRGTTISRGTTLRISEGSANSGDYESNGDGGLPLDVPSKGPLPFFQNLGGLPYYFTVEVGHFRADFLSTSTQTDSAISAAGPAASLFFSSVPKAAFGSTPHVLLPSDPKTIELGDMLEFYDNQYNLVSSSHAIIGLELSQLLVEVSPPISNTASTFELSLTKQVPFARIRKNRKNNYEVLKAALVGWLSLPENQVQYFRNLNRFINPLTSNTNPTASDVGTAKAHVQSLSNAITSLQTILAGYRVEVVARVDTLIDSFLQKGADRAVTLLLEGQFSVFFGLSQSGISYLGNALELLREVQKQDLPLRKVNRAGVRDQELVLASYEEPDAEFDLSDIQDVDEPDFFGPYTDSGDGNAY